MNLSGASEPTVVYKKTTVCWRALIFDEHVHSRSTDRENYCIGMNPYRSLKNGCKLLQLCEYDLTFPEFHIETETKVDFPSACI